MLIWLSLVRVKRIGWLTYWWRYKNSTVSWQFQKDGSVLPGRQLSFHYWQNNRENDLFQPFIAILVNCHMSTDVLTRIVSYPCQNSCEFMYTFSNAAIISLMFCFWEEKTMECVKHIRVLIVVVGGRFLRRNRIECWSWRLR